MKDYSNHDDGGSAKNDFRLYRRKCNRIMELFMLTGGMIVIVFFFSARPRRQEGIGFRNRIRSNQIYQHIQNKAALDNDDGEKLSRPIQHHDDDDDDTPAKHRWVNSDVLPPQTSDVDELKQFYKDLTRKMKRAKEQVGVNGHERVFRNAEYMDWEHFGEDELMGIKVDYTKHKYQYPDVIMEPPRGGLYPLLEPLENLMRRWPQDDIDDPPLPFVEKLQHFDYMDESQRNAAIKYRELEFPFKMVNVPEINHANERWTDDYLIEQFDSHRKKRMHQPNRVNAPSDGHCQQSVDSFFAFFNPKNWFRSVFGPPPTINNDFTFGRWAKHARYADATSLEPNKEHFYWQSGVPKEERLMPKDKWTFVSNDLPSFSSPEPTFFGFNPKEQKGIQCRFGERGVTAATHYDGGRNMVAMVTGAKRYILSPPKECGKLGIITERAHPTYRHSLLNFGNINLLDGPESNSIPKKEREWLELSKSSLAVETVLKAGEVLYIPSHWFHYITSLQKSAQCNTRSGQYLDGSPEFGGYNDVIECKL